MGSISFRRSTKGNNLTTQAPSSQPPSQLNSPSSNSLTRNNAQLAQSVLPATSENPNSPHAQTSMRVNANQSIQSHELNVDFVKTNKSFVDSSRVERHMVSNTSPHGYAAQAPVQLLDPEDWDETDAATSVGGSSSASISGYNTHGYAHAYSHGEQSNFTNSSISSHTNQTKHTPVDSFGFPALPAHTNKTGYVPRAFSPQKHTSYNPFDYIDTEPRSSHGAVLADDKTSEQSGRFASVDIDFASLLSD